MFDSTGLSLMPKILEKQIAWIRTLQNHHLNYLNYFDLKDNPECRGGFQLFL
jgi:hypothetical protein